MNGEFKKWSQEALLIMKMSEENNKIEHKRIVDSIDDLCLKLGKNLRKISIVSISFMFIVVSLIVWEVIENTSLLK